MPALSVMDLVWLVGLWWIWRPKLVGVLSFGLACGVLAYLHDWTTFDADLVDFFGARYVLGTGLVSLLVLLRLVFRRRERVVDPGDGDLVQDLSMLAPEPGLIRRSLWQRLFHRTERFSVAVLCGNGRAKILSHVPLPDELEGVVAGSLASAPSRPPYLVPLAMWRSAPIADDHPVPDAVLRTLPEISERVPGTLRIAFWPLAWRGRRHPGGLFVYCDPRGRQWTSDPLWNAPPLLDSPDADAIVSALIGSAD